MKLATLLSSFKAKANAPASPMPDGWMEKVVSEIITPTGYAKNKYGVTLTDASGQAVKIKVTDGSIKIPHASLMELVTPELVQFLWDARRGGKTLGVWWSARYCTMFLNWFASTATAAAELAQPDMVEKHLDSLAEFLMGIMKNSLDACRFTGSAKMVASDWLDSLDLPTQVQDEPKAKQSNPTADKSNAPKKADPSPVATPDNSSNWTFETLENLIGGIDSANDRTELATINGLAVQAANDLKNSAVIDAKTHAGILADIKSRVAEQRDILKNAEEVDLFAD